MASSGARPTNSGLETLPDTVRDYPPSTRRSVYRSTGTPTSDPYSVQLPS